MHHRDAGLRVFHVLCSAARLISIHSFAYDDQPFHVYIAPPAVKGT